ncbi:MAG: glycosyltransferase [Verrucomicrobia bacterium]|nr:glycosyltransferase [Verrucomicrobiota bacterium]
MNDSLTVLIPSYEDWDSIKLLLPQIESFLKDYSKILHIVIVNDASPTVAPEDLGKSLVSEFTTFRIVNLTRNLGHQRAIAIGLSFINSEISPHGAVTVMDADGEDAPKDIPKLLDKISRGDLSGIVFAERRRRSESKAFRIGYFLYKIFHLILTGRKIKVGNFSMISEQQLKNVITISELWNHYAAAVIVARIPVSMVRIDRAQRICGKSKMNYSQLVLHGLKAISVYSEEIGVRILFAMGATACIFTFVLIGVAFCYIAGIQIALGFAFALALLIILFLVVALTFLQFTLLVLQGRSMTSFIPARDYFHFIARVDLIK